MRFPDFLRQPDDDTLRPADISQPIRVPIAPIVSKGLLPWYSLFGGPASVRQLAGHLKLSGAYEVLYSHWSERIHAGNAMMTVAGPDKVIEHLRNAQGCQQATSFAVSFTLHATRELIQRYCPARLSDYRNWYIAEVQARYLEVAKGVEKIKVA
jgi:hypothetical protein